MHNPTSGFFGLMSTSNLIVSNPTIPSTLSVNAFGDDDVAPYHRPIWFYEELAEVTSPTTGYDCININPVIGEQTTYPRYNTLTSNFKNIALIAPIGLNTIEVTSNTANSCSVDSIVATITTIDPTAEVESME